MNHESRLFFSSCMSEVNSGKCVGSLKSAMSRFPLVPREEPDRRKYYNGLQICVRCHQPREGYVSSAASSRLARTTRPRLRIAHWSGKSLPVETRAEIPQVTRLLPFSGSPSMMVTLPLGIYPRQSHCIRVGRTSEARTPCLGSGSLCPKSEAIFRAIARSTPRRCV